MKKALLIAVMLMQSTILLAQQAEETDNDWKFRFTPYAWLTAVSGDLTAQGVTTDIDVSISDV